MMSHRKGMPVALKKIGANIAFSMPQRAPQIAIAATSRVLKYGTVYSTVTLF